jgi:hypothetical protein
MKEIISCSHKPESNKQYLGYIVIRPLPIAYIGRTALNFLPHTPELSCIIQPNSTSNLFGIPLTIKSLIFLQQDRSIGACSPTSLWIAINALHEKWDLGEIPAISELIEMNDVVYENINRSFPNAGLYIPQIELLIKKIGLEPDYITPEHYNSIQDLIVAYLNAKIPILAHIEFWNEKPNEDNQAKLPNEYWKVEKIIFPFEEKNDYTKEYTRGTISHMCVFSGFINSDSINDLTIQDQGFPSLDLLSSIYVHDDRIGPYERTRLREILLVDGYGRKQTILELNYSRNPPFDEGGFWVLTGLLIPSHPKIRVSFQHAKNLMITFNSTIIQVFKNQFKKLQESQDFNTIDENFIEFGEMIGNDIAWKIRLTTTNEYKSNVINNFDFDRSIELKPYILKDNLPRFLWLFQGFSSKMKKWICDIIIDATDIDPPLLFYRIWADSNYKSHFQNLARIILTDQQTRNDIIAKFLEFKFIYGEFDRLNQTIIEFWKNLNSLLSDY